MIVRIFLLFLRYPIAFWNDFYHFYVVASVAGALNCASFRTPQHLVADTILASRHSVIRPQGAGRQSAWTRLLISFILLTIPNHGLFLALRLCSTYGTQEQMPSGQSPPNTGPHCASQNVALQLLYHCPSHENQTPDTKILHSVSTSKRCIVQIFDSPMPSPTPGIRYPYSLKPHFRRDQQVLRDCTSSHPAISCCDSTHAK